MFLGLTVLTRQIPIRCCCFIPSISLKIFKTIVYDELGLMNAIKCGISNYCKSHLCMAYIFSKFNTDFETRDAWDNFLSIWYMVMFSPYVGARQEAWKIFKLFYKEKIDVLNYIIRT